MGTFKTQMLWEAIRKGDLTGAIGLLESGNINLEERDGVSSRERYHTIPSHHSQNSYENIVHISPSVFKGYTYSVNIYKIKEKGMVYWYYDVYFS